jgi:hypothetical protein
MIPDFVPPERQRSTVYAHDVLHQFPHLVLPRMNTTNSQRVLERRLPFVALSMERSCMQSGHARCKTV